MSQDRGATPAGFASNFAFGPIELFGGESPVRLVDLSDNAPGTAPGSPVRRVDRPWTRSPRST